MIPKVIHYCWFGKNKIPEKLQKCIDSWERIMPDYEIKQWNEDNYDINKCAYMKEAYEAKKWGFVPDYARLDICYTYGGIYLDTDVEVLKKFDALLNLEAFCGFEKYRDQKISGINIGQGFGCEKGHSTIKIMRDNYNDMHFVNSDGSLNLTASPRINTKPLEKLGLKYIDTIQNIGGLTIFPTEYFCPMNAYTGEINITQNTYSIHHFATTWFSQADQERWELRRKYGRYGKFLSEVISTFITYRKHYGIFGMWREILKKLSEKKRSKYLS